MEPRLPPRLRPIDFHDLMRHRIMDVLLVASPYDAFLLEEAGQLSERVLGEFRNLDLHYGPGITTVPTGEEALSRLAEPGRFGLVVSALRLRDMSGGELARRMRADGIAVPIALLGHDGGELAAVSAREDLRDTHGVFLWQGDARILLAIVKSVEDRANAPYDTRTAGVQVVILVEDNVRDCSSFLPALYAELLHQSQALVSEGANLSEKITRMRARPKVLLARTLEEAWADFEAYEEDVLGVVSDVGFPREGAWSATAGLELARRVRQRRPDVAVLLQSSHAENEAGARAEGAEFLQKGSPLLLSGLRRFMLASFGFGEFVFRLPDGRPVGRAGDLRTLQEQLATVPAASVAFHAGRNHFSTWLKARTEFALAHQLRPRQVSDFGTVEAMRAHLIVAIDQHRRRHDRLVVADFDHATYDGGAGFCRIGGGSLGGKARGLAFMRVLLADPELHQAFPGVEIGVPAAVVLGTDVFDRFLDYDDLRELALGTDDDQEIARRFAAAPFPADDARDLRAWLAHADGPLAVRSSSLLEDSQSQPFSGVYETIMVPNDAADLGTRLEHLLASVKRIYASTFHSRTKAFIRATPYRLEEERMAVIVQRLMGRRHGTRFYPDAAGVARSHDFYPRPPLRSEDGIAVVALGLGRTVVEEGTGVRFCPRRPRHGHPSARELVHDGQRAFWALDLGPGGVERRCDIADAEADGTLAAVASTWSAADEALRDGVSRPGVRVVTFSGILNHEDFPLARLLDRLLALGTWGMGSDVEIEFAALLGPPGAAELGFLQLRPFARTRETEQLRIGSVDPALVLCQSAAVLGNGQLELFDVVVVDRDRFERAASVRTAADVALLNASLLADGRPYLLVGVGRWGSADPWLGIPVLWQQISGARAIVEAGFRDLVVTPSQGTHFFQNLTSFGVGYFTVGAGDDARLDWDWLAAQPALRTEGCVRHLRFERPLRVTMNGREQRGVILKP